MTGAPGSTTVEIVRGAARFEAVGAAWRRLWSDAGGSVFQSHDWISAWFQTLPVASRVSLHLALAWQGDALVGAMPLARRSHWGLRVLEWAAKDFSDYCDVLVSPGHDAQDVVRQLWDGVSTAGGFDLAYLSHIGPDARIAASILSDDKVRGAFRPTDRRATSLRVRTSGIGGDVWFEGLSKKARQNYRRGQKAIGEVSTATFRLVPPEEPLARVLERLVALKRDWLERTGQRSALLDDGAGILTALVTALARTGRLRVFVLECEGRLIAGSINFVEHGRMMAFFATYDVAFERASPGMVIMVDYMKWAFDRGIAEVDFLCGAEDYKRRFANAEVELASVVAVSTIAGRAALALDDGLTAWRSWRKRRAVTGTAAGGPSVADDLQPAGKT